MYHDTVNTSMSALKFQIKIQNKKHGYIAAINNSWWCLVVLKPKCLQTFALNSGGKLHNLHFQIVITSVHHC